MGRRAEGRRLRDRTWFFPAVCAAVGVPGLAAGVIARTPGWVGLALMMLTLAGGAPVSNWLVRNRDGTRLHGAACTAAAVALLAASALIVADAEMFFASRGRYGAAVVLFVAPLLGVMGARLAWWGVGLLVHPRPHWVRDRRRARPHRLPVGVPDGEGGWVLSSPASAGGTWRLPAATVVRTSLVGPPRKGRAMRRTELAAALDDLGAPAFVHALWVEGHALEFPVEVDGPGRSRQDGSRTERGGASHRSGVVEDA